MSSENTTPDTTEYAIEVSGLGKCYQIYDKPSDRLKQMLMRGRKQYYKEFWALKDVSFKIKKGETVGIIGRNGSGKSTLLQMLCGTLNPTGGEVKVNGRVAALLELGAGFNPEFSGVENVYMAASLYGLSKEEVDQRFDAIATFADIGEHIHQPVKTYSSGMYVRLAFAVIAHVDANVLVVDEALAVGDIYFTQKCMKFIRNFMQSGTVIFVSHDIGTVKAMCDSAIYLKQGRIQLRGSSESVCNEFLADYYGSISGGNSVTTTNSIKLAERLTDIRSSYHKDGDSVQLIKIGEFFDGSSSFGVGDCKVESVEFIDENKNSLRIIYGLELVRLKVAIKVYKEIEDVIVGFYVKDRLGQFIFGDNTYLACKELMRKFDAGENMSIEFEFVMPRLMNGEYVVCAAVASGTQADHVQQHWLNDALAFVSSSNCHSGGLIGLPMNNIEVFYD